MGICTLTVERFLTGTARSPVLGPYCEARHLPQPVLADQGDIDAREEAVLRWVRSLSGLPGEQQARLEHEMEAVADLAAPLGNAHLLDSSADVSAPAVARGMPLALWFLLHRPALFDEVHRNHLHRDLEVRRAARVAVRPDTIVPADAAPRLARALEELYRGESWHVSRHELHSGVAFVATRRSRGPILLLDRPLASDRLEFAYHPDAGTLLLQPGLGPEQAVHVLLEAFASCIDTGLLPGPAFDLDRLRWPFRPQPDALDLEEARLKTLHLVYPERDGKRMVVLDTLESDRPSAVEDLVAGHIPEEVLLELMVHQAVLQVRLRVRTVHRHHLIRLYPHYCDLGRGRLGERLLACVRRWGL